MMVKKRLPLIILGFSICLFYGVYWFVTAKIVETGFQNWVIGEIKNNQADIQFKAVRTNGFPLSVGLQIDDFYYKKTDKTMDASIPSVQLNVNPFNWADNHFTFAKGVTLNTVQNGQQSRITIQSLNGYFAVPFTRAKTSFGINLKTINLNLPPMRGQTARFQTTLDHLNLSFTATPALPQYLSDQTVSQWRDQGGIIKISDSTLSLLPTVAHLDGDLSLTADNQPQFNGFITLVEGQSVLTRLTQSGQTPEQNLLLAKNFMISFEKLFPNPNGDGLKIPFTMRAGFLSVGPFPVMPIPQIHWAIEN